MSRLPYAVDQRQTPNAPGLSLPSIASADTSQAPAAMNQLGKTLEGVGNVAMQLQGQKDRFNYSIARSKFLQKSVELENQLENDPDYSNLPTKYSEGITKIKQETLGDLGKNTKAGLLDQEINLYKTKKLGDVVKLAQRKQGDFALAEADKTLDQNLDFYLRANNEDARNGLITSSIENFAEAIPLNDPDRKVKIQNFTQKVGQRFAEARLSSLSPSDQLQVLSEDKKAPNSNFIQLIPADDRLKFEQRAKQEIEQQKDNAIATIRQNDFLKERQAKENALQSVINGGSVAQIPIQQYARLSDSDRNNLNKIQQIQSGLYQIDPVEGIKAYNKYSELYSVDPSELAKIDPIEIRASVAPDKVNEVMSWQQKAMQGVPQNAAEKSFNGTANFYVTKVLKKKFNEPDAALFINKFREAKQEFVDSKGKQPNNEELRYIANGLVAQEAVDGSLWGTNKKPLYKMTGKEEAPDDIKNQIVAQARAKNPNTTLTDEQINQIYFRKISKKPIE